MRRYVTGTGQPFAEMFTDAEWQPPLGWLALVLAYTAASIVFVAWAGRIAAHPIDATPAPVELGTTPRG
jgi:hypothetical protein